MTTDKWVHRKFKIETRHDESLARAVEEEGGNILTSWLVNAALDQFFNGNGEAHQ